MPAISPTTRMAIKGYLEGFLNGLVTRYRGTHIPEFRSPSEYLAYRPSREEGKQKPFHAAMIPPELQRISAFERGFSTSLGTTFEECARLIALDHHHEAHRGRDFTGRISLASINEIERQVASFERASLVDVPKPDFEQMLKAVFDARRNDDLEIRTIRADLYICANDGTEFFFEMKSPDPNKGQCLEVTQRLLKLHLIRGRLRPSMYAYFAMAYNPYGPTRADYKWAIAMNYMPFEQVVVIGQEFWNIVGGPTTYEELLEIYQEVGREKSKYIIDALAFGF